MKAIGLGKSQRAVLYVDIGNPEMTDTELSRIVGISPGRISTIRSQLIHDGFYHEIKIPSLDRLGFEGLGIVIAEPRNPRFAEDEQNRLLIQSFGRNPNVIYAIESGGILIFITAFPRLSSFEAFSDEVFELCCKLGETDCQTIVASFPLDISKIHSFWDFSSLLHEKFASHIPPPKKSVSYGSITPDVKMDTEDLRILDLMLKNPIANDADIAKSMGVSLSTFRRIKERILSNGFCRRAFVPEISKLGFELCVFSLLRLNPCRSRIGEVDHIRSLVSPWPFLLTSRKSMAFIGYCFSDYTTYSRFSSKVLSDLKRNSIHLDVIRMLPFPTASMNEIKPLDFSGILTPLLGSE